MAHGTFNYSQPRKPQQQLTQDTTLRFWMITCICLITGALQTNMLGKRAEIMISLHSS